jgi:hypothetical protein
MSFTIEQHADQIVVADAEVLDDSGCLQLGGHTTHREANIAKAQMKRKAQFESKDPSSKKKRAQPFVELDLDKLRRYWSPRKNQIADVSRIGYVCVQCWSGRVPGGLRFVCPFRRHVGFHNTNTGSVISSLDGLEFQCASTLSTVGLSGMCLLALCSGAICNHAARFRPHGDEWLDGEKRGDRGECIQHQIPVLPMGLIILKGSLFSLLALPMQGSAELCNTAVRNRVDTAQSCSN